MAWTAANTEAVRLKRQERRALGQCVDCGEPASGVVCPIHKKARLKYRRKYNRAVKYGLSNDGVAQLLEAQDHKCAICTVELKDDRHTHIDHDHATDKVRGLLCAACNKGLGNFKDRISSLSNAIAYLFRFG